MDRTQQLWRCMLELQEKYGCYHCTRMDLAMDAGDEGVNYMRTSEPSHAGFSFEC